MSVPEHGEGEMELAMFSQKDPVIDVYIKGLGHYQVSRGSTIGELVQEVQQQMKHLVVAAVIGNELQDLHYKIEDSCEIELIDLSSETGFRIYRRSVVFLLIRACRELIPQTEIVIKHSLSNGLYCEMVDVELTPADAEQIQKRMREYVVRDLPINKLILSREEAGRIYTRQGQMEKVKLLEYRNRSIVHMYELDGFYEYFYGHMVPYTGMVDNFKIMSYPPGLILQTPEVTSPETIHPWVDLPKLFAVYKEAKEWAEMLGTQHVAALNEIIECGDLDDIIRVNEALHEKKIASIADQICNNRDIRLVLISGPSSSGKTTFAQRLLIQLRVNGRRPVSVSLDNYFVDRSITPRDEQGDYDFEALEALKLDLFNEHLCKLINGEEVTIPVYNFQKGTCEPYGLVTRVPPGEPIIIEGIHGLNDRLTWSIPARQKFKIYISALTQLNIDYSNRIPTTDCRLLRRIIRDSRTRGYSALETLRRWPSVRRGEERNIFPFQENADIMFNSSLVYELAMLKILAEPLLAEITPEFREHVEAERLLKFLSYFRPAKSDQVPLNSILREFIGGSCFKG